MDIDSHNPQQLAAINNREEILRYLDGTAAKLEATDKKKAYSMKEKAKKEADKRIKEFVKSQQKTEREHVEKKRSGMFGLKKVFGSHGNLSTLGKADSNSLQNNQDLKYSDLVGGGGTMTKTLGPASRKINQIKMNRQANEFKVGERENGNRTLRNLEGLSRDNEVLYVGTFQNSNNEKRGKITDVFLYDSNSINDDDRRNIRQGTLSAWRSQPDLAVTSSNDIAQDMKNQRPTGLFDRHMLGGALSIGQSVTSAISSSIDQASNHSSNESGSAKKQQKKSQRPQLLLSSDSEESDGSQNSSDENEESNQPLKRFLAAYSLEQHYDLLLHHQIDLDTLMILTEDDLKTLDLPLGPYRRLAVAIAERKQALTNPGAIIDSRL